MSSARHLTGAAGRWSATHPWTAILAWLGCVVALLVTGHLVGTYQLPSTQYSNGESYQAQQMLSHDFTMNASEQVLFDSSSLRVSSPAFQDAIRDVAARIQATGQVTRIRSPLDPAYANLIAPTQRAALLQFAITGDHDTAYSRVGPVLAAVQAAAAAHPRIQIAETGDASINKAANDTVLRDLRRTEALSYPITLVVLLIAFGALVAALLPLGLALMAILAATGLLAFASYAYGVTPQTSSVLIAIGLAVGVDYSMFYVKRQREERAAGRPVLDAIEVAAATSGRSVLISGLTVLLAMSGMLLAGNGVFHAMGEGGDAGRGLRRHRIADPAAGLARAARRPGEPGSAAIPQPAAAPRRPEPGLGRDSRPDPGPARADRRGISRRPGRARAACAAPAHRRAGRQ